MSILIFSQDDALRASLHRFCLELGLADIFAVAELSSAVSTLENQASGIRLMLVAGSPEAASLVLALGHCESESPSLALAPLVLIMPHRQVFDFVRVGPGRPNGRTGRVDRELARPLNRTRLRRALEEAYEHRAQFRDTVLLFGGALGEAAHRPLWSPERKLAHHWKNVLWARNPQELSLCLEQQGARVGAILIEPVSCTKDLLGALTAYRKTPIGMQTPVVILSQEAERILPLRTLGEAFVPFDPRLEQALELSSTRLRRQWITSALRHRSIEILKAEHRKDASVDGTESSGVSDKGVALALLEEALRFDARWEVQEELGRWHMKFGEKKAAIRCFQEVLKTNPCAPRAYLSLLTLLPEGSPEEAEMLRAAARYCPNVPQVREQIEKRSRAA